MHHNMAVVRQNDFLPPLYMGKEKLFKLNGFGMVVFPDRPNVCIDAEETENTEDIEEENE